MNTKNIDENISIDIKNRCAYVYVNGVIKRVAIKNLYKVVERVKNAKH